MRRNSDPKRFLQEHNLHLNTQQQQALGRIDGKTLLLAVPGSGKTTVLISRLGYMIQECGIRPEEILTLTFSRAGVRDLKERYQQVFGAEAETVRINTIHSFALSVIRDCQKRNGRKAFEVLEDRRGLLREIYKKYHNHYPSEADLGEIDQKLTYVKNLMLKKEAIERVFADEIRIREDYEKYKDANHLIDFDDMLIYAYRLLKRNPKLLESYRERYKYIQVDEAQDNSRVQHEIIKMLVGEDGNLFMVADEDQSIYGFRGAFPNGVLDFDKTFKDGHIIKMETNYRSSKSLVEPANRFIVLNRGRYPKDMKTERLEGQPPVHEFFRTEEERDNFIISSVQREGKETAVLFRNNDSAVPIVDLLDRKGIPFMLRESNPAFFSNFLMYDLESFYRLSKNPADIEAFRRLWYKLRLMLSKENINQFAKIYKNRHNIWETLLSMKLPGWLKDNIMEAQGTFKSLAHRKPADFMRTVLYDLQYEDYLDYSIQNESNRENISHKIDILKTIARRETTMEGFFKRLGELREIMASPQVKTKRGNLTLSTIHSAKGLEFEKVFLIDVTKTILPSPSTSESVAEQEREFQEEVRLFYVGVTRAKQELEFLSIGSPYSQPPGREVSPFIDYYFNPEKINREIKEWDRRKNEEQKRLKVKKKG